MKITVAFNGAFIKSDKVDINYVLKNAGVYDCNGARFVTLENGKREFVTLWADGSFFEPIEICAWSEYGFVKIVGEKITINIEV